jgi:hypothetical protein
VEAVAEGGALADAEGLAIVVPLIVDPLFVALGVALADAEGLAIILSSIICPLGIICLWFMC